MRRTLAAAMMAGLAAPASSALATPFLPPTYDVSAGGVILLQTNGPGAGGPPTTTLLALPNLNVPNPPGIAPIPPFYREYNAYAADPCFYVTAGAGFTCTIPDLLNDPTAAQHWEVELDNANGSFVTLNTFFTFSSGAAWTFMVGLAPGSTVHFDFLIAETFTDVATWVVGVRSGAAVPLGLSIAVTEGGTPTANTPPGTPPFALSGVCPGPVVTQQPCAYAFHSDPADFIIAGSDPNLPSLVFTGFVLPEPASLSLLATGLACLVIAGTRRGG